MPKSNRHVPISKSIESQKIDFSLFLIQTRQDEQKQAEYEELVSLRKRCQDLEQEAEELKAIVKNLEKERDDSRGRCEELENEAKILQDHNTEMQSMQDDLHVRIQELENELNSRSPQSLVCSFGIYSDFAG